MKLLIILTNPIPLIIHETLSLAFALASFGHDIQLDIGNTVANQLLVNPENALAKMLSSLDLYDIPPAWISTDIYQKFEPNLTDTLTSQIMQKPTVFEQFEGTLSF